MSEQLEIHLPRPAWHQAMHAKKMEAIQRAIAGRTKECAAALTEICGYEVTEATLSNAARNRARNHWRSEWDSYFCDLSGEVRAVVAAILRGGRPKTIEEQRDGWRDTVKARLSEDEYAKWKREAEGSL